MAERTGLELKRLSVTLGGAALFAPLSITVSPGEVVAVTGPSGIGKSTLLSAICGTLDPGFRIDGEILLNGVSLIGVPTEKRRVGILFQDDLLFPHMTVGENLGFGLPSGLSRAERRAKVKASLAEAGLEGFDARDPTTLSGGQRARVACLRALLADPSVLLLDEPFSALDPEARARFRRFVFETTARRGLPVLLVTHDVRDIEELAERARFVALAKNGI